MWQEPLRDLPDGTDHAAERATDESFNGKFRDEYLSLQWFRNRVELAIRPKRQDDWAVVPTLWGLAVGAPGSMKSPALAEALRPLRRLVTDAQARYEEHRLAQQVRVAEQKARRHDLARRVRDAVANQAPTEALREPVEAARRDPPPVELRYLVNDTTVEKLGELLNHNPNGLLLFRDELSGFLHTMDRPGRENDRAFYCEAWNGTGAYTYDRIGRGTLHIRAACVSVLGGIQPGPLERYLRGVFAGRGDDGLLQRFQLAVWPDGGGRWQNVDRWPNADARARVNEVFQRLSTLEPAALGAEELTPEELPFLRFEAAAQECFDAWRGDLEQRRGAQNVIWGMPWISNEPFPGLAYCIGGRSLFWGGWSPALTDADLTNWPSELVTYLKSAGGYGSTAAEIGTATTTEFITKTALFDALFNGFKSAVPLDGVTEVGEAPLAVQGSAPRSGLFAFDKFSSAPFIMDALRNDVAVNTGYGDLSRRIFLVPRSQVHRLNLTGNTVTSIDMSVAGVRQQLSVTAGTAVIIANGTIEATRLGLESLGVGSQQFGSPRVGNLMAHLRSNITVRIKRAALGLSTPPVEVETAALILRGSAQGRRFHHQVTAAASAGPNPEANMWSMIPDIDLIDNLLGKQDPNWVAITFRGIGEMEDQRVVGNIDPARSWIDLSQETDQWGMRRAYVHLVATPNDRTLWAAMDKSAFDLAKALAKAPGNIEYWNARNNQWQATQPQPDANGQGFWQDFLGTTHHEAGTLFMGTAGASITDTNGKFHGKANVYAVGPSVFPTLGSANPSLTALSLARRTANAIVVAAGPSTLPGFVPLSVAPADWQMVKLPNSPATMVHYGSAMETAGWYGLYWYVKEQFANFILSLDWRISRRDENSGVYIRVPAPNVPNALQGADAKGHEIQIDQRGYDSVTNTEGHSLKVTGAIYDLQAPSASTQVQIGAWNNYLIEANGPRIRVTLNGQLVNEYQSSREQAGYLALQAHDSLSRTQFRNLRIRKLP